MDLSAIINLMAGMVFFLFWLVTFVIFYHLTRFGIGVQPKRLAALFLLGSVTLSVVAMIFFASVDLSIISLS